MKTKGDVIIMKQKKLIIGSAIMALALTTGVAAYAADSQKNAQANGVSYVEKISMSGEGALSLEEMDKDNLPDGVSYKDEISMSGEGAQTFSLNK